ncbi:MAG: cob(I)yrinic acid a,c-diamide adenosyltransferase [Acidimicrobiales bacterium]
MTAEPPTTPPARAAKRAPSIVLVATGDGKGKTTAAIGTALRSIARNWPVCVVQFLKSGDWNSGEVRLLSQLGAQVHTFGDGFTWDSSNLQRSAELARSAWALARDAIASGRYRLVVLDELTYPVNWGWVALQDVTACIANRPPKVNIFVTGRDAPNELTEVADTVTDMRNVKHAYDAGIMAAKGIDF